jgi:hypothetical protein
MALSTRRRDRSYPSPITDFDDSNRERYIARSGGIGSLKPMGTIVDYNLGKGGRDPSMIGGFGLGPSGLMDPVIEIPTGGPVDMIGQDRSDTTLDMLLDDVFGYKPLQEMERPILPKDFVPEYEAPILPKDFVPEFIPAGLLGPGSGLGDPTGEGGIIQRLGEMLGLTPRTDPENEGLPMDEFQEYDPNNPNMFMLPDDMDPNDMDMENIINQMREPRLEATADTYTLPNLLQMLDDARDAGDDSYDTILEDIQLRYPGATMDVAELTDDQKNFMLSPLQNPDFQSQESLFNKVKQMEDKGFFGFGAQEPTTMEEMLEFMDSDQYKRAFI